jgi:uncharacterized protein YbjQ (UPF0145 family)
MSKTIAQKLPVNLQPKAERDEITVDVQLTGVRDYTPEQVATLRRKLGLEDVNTNIIETLPELGELAVQLGVIKTIKGSTLMGQEALIAAISQMSNVVQDQSGKYKPKQKEAAAKAIGYLTEKLAKLNTSVVKVDATVADVVMREDVKRRNTFKAGMAVRSTKAKTATTNV